MFRLFTLSLSAILLFALGINPCRSQQKPNPSTAVQPAVSAPRSFEAIAISSTEIRCYWLAAADATGYRLMRDGVEIAALPENAREYADTGLSPDSTHRYTLEAIQGTQASSPAVYTERTFAPLHSGSYDVVIVQASSGGVAAAYEAAKRGLKVALIEPTTRLGGMPVNGLSATDLRRPEHASGFLARFRDRVRDLYAAEGIKTNGLQYEPRIAHQAMKSLLYEVPGITIFRRTRLASVHTGRADREGLKRVDSIIVEELKASGEPTGSKAELRGKVFVDSTDCGDLAALAGADYRLGRERRTKEEPHNGVIYYDRKNDKPLPGSTGEADRRIQAYTYLLTVKDYGAGADRTIAKPAGYRKEDFQHSPAWKDSWAVTSGKMPGSKFELNQHPEGGDLQGINYNYATGSPHSGGRGANSSTDTRTASPIIGGRGAISSSDTRHPTPFTNRRGAIDYRERERVKELYRQRVLGYLYYIQTEFGQKQIGLPDDEYRDTGGFPPLLYVREGRRIIGEQLPNESDIEKSQSYARPESIGLADYPMDSHAVRPKTNWSSPDMGEGEWWLYQHTPWHEIPLGVMVPKQLSNVFVTTAVSSTHVSFGTYRMEPVRMAFGQAAGVAAALAIRYNLAGREVPARQIQDELLARASNPAGDPNILLSYFSDIKPDNRQYAAIQYMAARGFRLNGDELKPDAPTTRGELARWLNLLSQRAAPYERQISRTETLRPFYPYMGAPLNLAAFRDLQNAGSPDEVLTRGEIAQRLASILPPMQVDAKQKNLYSDLSDAADIRNAEAIAAHGIDSFLWDGWDATIPDDKLLFKPSAPISHQAMLATLYAAQRTMGPLFNDNPVDGRNGRHVPPALWERVVK